MPRRRLIWVCALVVALLSAFLHDLGAAPTAIVAAPVSIAASGGDNGPGHSGSDACAWNGICVAPVVLPPAAAAEPPSPRPWKLIPDVARRGTIAAPAIRPPRTAPVA